MINDAHGSLSAISILTTHFVIKKQAFIELFCTANIDNYFKSMNLDVFQSNISKFE